MSKAQFIALAGVIILLSVAYLLLIAIRDYTDLGNFSESYLEQDSKGEIALDRENEAIAEFADPKVIEIIEVYRQQNYVLASDVTDEFTDLVTEAYRDDIFVLASELEINNNEKIVIVTAPTREFNQEFCGLYGQEMCFILYDNGENVKILNIMDFLIREQTFEPDFEFNMDDPLFANMSGSHWMLEEYIKDEDVVFISAGIGDAGASGLTYYALDLKTTAKTEIVSIDSSIGEPTIIQRDDTILVFNFEYEQTEGGLNHHFGTIETGKGGEVLAEIDETNDQFVDPEVIDIIDTYENVGEIWFTLFGQQYSFNGEKLKKR
ncbi:MAG: hypothetical protein ABH846_03860 [Patescibacteria group bacterium]